MIKPGDDEIQTECWISTGGHLWMEGFFDKLPLSVRRRLRSSPYNLCSACLVTEFAPKVQSRYPNCSHEKVLLIAIEVMEAQLRKGAVRR